MVNPAQPEKSEAEKLLAEFSYGISYKKLESLLLFAENASVTEAANKKSREAGSVTRDLNALDEFFGCTLRNRTGKNSVISPQGQELVSLLRRHLQELRDFRDKTTRSLNHVSLAAGDSLLHVLVLPSLSQIQLPFPKTTVAVSAARTFEIIRGLQYFTLDLGLLRESSLPLKVEEEAGEPLSHRPIGNYGYAIFVPKNLLNQMEQNKCNVFDLPFAMIKHHWDTSFVQLAQSHNVVFKNIGVLCENFIQVYHLVRLGGHAGILPLFCEPLVKNAVRIDPAFLKEPIHKVVLAWNPALVKIKTKLQPFIDSTAQVLQSVFNATAT
jgi:DNA-binding transcriptional LysR family regulator